MANITRRQLLSAAGPAVAALAGSTNKAGLLLAEDSSSDSLPMQLYKSLSEEQRKKIVLPVDHKSRHFVSNWWYVHRDHRIPRTFDQEQQELIQQIFDSLHSPEHQAAVNKQVEMDQYGNAKNAPSVGFFGTPEDADFEFIYTGHHVTRRCNAHFDEGRGFGGAPIFYGHFANDFHETKDHVGNPYWYQGKLFNNFVQSLDGEQQLNGLQTSHPRSEKANAVVSMSESRWPGLACSELSQDQKDLLVKTMGDMMAMFRQSDVDATLGRIKESDVLDNLHVSWFGGKYDIGADKVWDTWQIEGPDMVWYFRGEPHIHSYFHLDV